MAFSCVRKKSLHNTELPGNIEQTNTYKKLNYVETTHFHIFVLLNYSGVFFILAVSSTGSLSVKHFVGCCKVQTTVGNNVKYDCFSVKLFNFNSTLFI